MKSTVAICIPTFNQSAFLTKAIQSCLDQTYSPIEIWVSDDCSTDDTEKIIQPLLANSNIHYFRQEHNLGISANNNWLLSQPKTEFILRLDSDDALHPDYITTLLPIIQQDRTLGYAHAAVHEINPIGDIQRLRALNRPTGSETAAIALQKSIYGYRVAANICLFRSAVLRELHYYKPGLNFGEDWELSIRIAAAGFGNYYDGTALSYYRVWNDTHNIRAKRKLIEIQGISEIFTQTLYPIFETQRLNIRILKRAQQKAALNHSIALGEKSFSLEEKHHLIQALLQLSNTWRVQLKIKFLQ